VCVLGQNIADIFDERALQNELSQERDDDDDDVVDDADDDVDDETDEEAERGVASGDDDHIADVRLHSASAQRQHSTTEYLPGMLHSNSPPGLLPKFPSWSLVQLGDYCSYSPSTGNCVLINNLLYSNYFYLRQVNEVSGRDIVFV